MVNRSRFKKSGDRSRCSAAAAATGASAADPNLSVISCFGRNQRGKVPAARKRRRNRPENWMPLGRSPRVPRRGASPNHALCGPVPRDPPWWSSGMDYGAAAVVAGVACILYWGTVNAEFAYDDSRAIKTNQDLLPSTPITSIFKNDFWGTPITHSGSHKSYRPICVLTFRLNYALGGFSPWGYHFGNVVLHALVSAVFYRMAAAVFVGRVMPAVVAGLLFAAHPIHTEAVAGVVGRADIGACLFFLLCLLLYVRYCEYREKEVNQGHRRFLYLSGSMLCATLSMLTKEHGVTVIAICAVYDILVQSKATLRDTFAMFYNKRFHGTREGFLCLLLTAVLLLGLRLHLMGSKPPDFAPADNPAADNTNSLTRSLTFSYLPAFNFWLMLCPKWLSFDWSMESIPLLTKFSDTRNSASAAFYISLLVMIIWLIRAIHIRRQWTENDFLWDVYYRSEQTVVKNTRYGMAVPVEETRWWRKNPFPGIAARFSAVFRKNNAAVAAATADSTKAGYNNNDYGHMTGHRMSNGYGHYHHGGHNVNAYRYAQARNWKQETFAIWTPFLGSADIVTFSLALMILPFIPATNLFFYVGFVVAERVLYIPSMGFCLLVALGMDNLYRRQQRSWRKKIIMTSLVVVLIILSLRTIRRNHDWLNEENLYRSGIPINPPKAYGNLANILSGQGKKAEAEWAYKRALAYRSSMADVRYNLGILLQEQGRYEEALCSYKLAIQFRPRLAMAHLNMGLVLGILGRKEEAAEVYRHCAELDGAGLKDPKMHETTRISALFNLGRLYADEGKYQEAMQVYYEAVRKMPDHYQPQSLYNMMGEAFYKMGQFAEAEHWYREALKVKPDHIPAHLTYAKLLAKWNRSQDAEKWFLRAKTLAPNDSSVYQHYGQFLSETERHAEAADTYVRAAELAPDDYEIVFSAANTLRQAGRNIEAENYYSMAVKLRPNEVTSHMNLGAMFHVNGKLQEAENAYMQALRLKPDDPVTQNNLQKLRNLRKGKKQVTDTSLG